mmetsp:Transcript_2601/g.4028  ORF Transcript_2601/g.4028 Transcript_2601/m.4028 type:complete len:96 (+) Transcript_2601:668-955(+)
MKTLKCYVMCHSKFWKNMVFPSRELIKNTKTWQKKRCPGKRNSEDCEVKLKKQCERKINAKMEQTAEKIRKKSMCSLSSARLRLEGAFDVKCEVF